ncbi:MAG: hypothetical protein ACWA6U_07925 [Breznakibacter sp.]
MSNIKDIYIEIERAKSTLHNLIKAFSNLGLFHERPENYLYLEILDKLLNGTEQESIRDFIFEYLKPIDLNLRKLGFDFDTGLDNLKYNKDIRVSFLKLKSALNQYENRFNPRFNEREKAVNSEKYYIDRIDQLKNQEIELRDILKSNIDESVEQKKITEETQKKLIEIEEELIAKNNELEFRQKQEDAKNNWELKIKTTFANLQSYLEPINNEKSRLNVLYYSYFILTLFSILLVVTIEIIAIHKITAQTNFPDFKGYITLFLPIPIAGALMWGFIFQMNRAQRQLIVMSNTIHSVKYVQGLLLSVNNLSPSINDGITRINIALDKIISNHLNNKPLGNESEILNEESKDKVPIDLLLKILKEIKNVTT